MCEGIVSPLTLERHVRQVTIGIVVYNHQDTISQTVRSVARQSFSDFLLVVWDNGSRDRSREIIQREPAVGKFIFSERNVGFSSAHNEIIRRFPSRYYFCLNPDVILHENYLELLLEKAERVPSAGSLSGRLYRFNSANEKVIDTVGHRMSYGLRCSNVGSGSKDCSAWVEEGERFGLCAAATVYTRRAIETVSTGGGFFDERYFAYWEDVDLDWRLHCEGFRAVYVPEALAYHLRGARVRRDDSVLYLGERNRYLFVRKYRPQFLSLKIFWFYYIGEVYLLLKCFLSSEARRSLRAKLDAAKIEIRPYEKRPSPAFLRPPYFHLSRREVRRTAKTLAWLLAMAAAVRLFL